MRFLLIFITSAVLAAESAWIPFPDPRFPVAGLAWLAEHPTALIRFSATT